MQCPSARPVHPLSFCCNINHLYKYLDYSVCLDAHSLILTIMLSGEARVLKEVVNIDETTFGIKVSAVLLFVVAAWSYG